MEFIERTGHQPVRMVVEQNIRDLSNRIREVAYNLLVLIQKLWRGIMARRSVAYFRTEIVRLRQNDVAYVLKIQRAYRGHASRRLHVPRLVEKHTNQSLLDSYLTEKNKAHSASVRQNLNNRILLEYRNERRNEATLRYTSRIHPPSAYDGKKMKAFASSCYFQEEVSKRISHSIKVEEEHKNRNASNRKESKNRKHFIVSRIREYGPKGFGLRGEPRPPPPRYRTMSSSISSNMCSDSNEKVSESFESSRSRGMRAYFQDELKKLVEEEVRFATHNFERLNLLSRFRDFNTNKSNKNQYIFPATLMSDSLKELLNDDEDQYLMSLHNKRRLLKS